MFINRDEYLCKVPLFWSGCSSAGVIWPLLSGWAVRWLRWMELQKGLRVGLILARLLWGREDLPGSPGGENPTFVPVGLCSSLSPAGPAGRSEIPGFSPKTLPSVPGSSGLAPCHSITWHRWAWITLIHPSLHREHQNGDAEQKSTLVGTAATSEAREPLGMGF